MGLLPRLSAGTSFGVSYLFLPVAFVSWLLIALRSPAKEAPRMRRSFYSVLDMDWVPGFARRVDDSCAIRELLGSALSFLSSYDGGVLNRME